MSKKRFLVVLAPLAAIVALAVIPVGAQAVLKGPHYYINGSTPGAKLAFGKKVKTIAWGKLKNTSALGTITCDNIAIGQIENPASEEEGRVETQNFATAQGEAGKECELSGCPVKGFARPAAGSLPWTGTLKFDGLGGEVRQDAGSVSPVKVILGCEATSDEKPAAGGEIEFFTNAGNKQQPRAVNGAKGCNAPSELEFDTATGTSEGAGTLESAAGKGTTTLSLKTCGYLKQDLLDTGA